MTTTEKYSINSYPLYKESGMEHLGLIPEHWSLSPLKFIVSSKPNSMVDGPFGSDLKNEDYVESGIPLIQLNNITNLGKHVLQNMKFISEEKALELRRHIILPGEIVIAKMAEPVARAACVSNEYDKYVIVADCVKFSPDHQRVYIHFLIYSFNNHYFRIQAELQATGTTRLRVNLSTLKNLCVLIPTLQEQINIARFLDHHTSKIDKIIADKERMIILLQEQRQAIISEAVTKGSDPNVPMKGSGIESLGDVPFHWEIKALKHFGKVIGGYAFKSSDFTSVGIRVIKISNVQHMHLDWDDESFLPEHFFENHKEFSVEDGSLIFALTRPIISTGIKATIVNTNGEKLLFNQRTGLFKPSKDIDTEYLSYLVTSKQFTIEFSKGVKTTNQPNISTEDIGNIRFCFPEINEQRAICTAIRPKLEIIESTITDIKVQIQKLHEYRQSLITEAVTGKIDVSGWKGAEVV